MQGEFLLIFFIVFVIDIKAAKNETLLTRQKRNKIGLASAVKTVGTAFFFMGFFGMIYE